MKEFALIVNRQQGPPRSGWNEDELHPNYGTASGSDLRPVRTGTQTSLKDVR